MNARLARNIVLGALLVAVVAVLLVYGGHTGVILGRIAMRVF
ncbi:hypothetical protein [Streptomyces sp. WELS2]|nr:hypothetical protein [Streptomyces sp. WELS2]